MNFPRLDELSTSPLREIGLLVYIYKNLLECLHTATKGGSVCKSETKGFHSKSALEARHNVYLTCEMDALKCYAQLGIRSFCFVKALYTLLSEFLEPNNE